MNIIFNAYEKNEIDMLARKRRRMLSEKKRERLDKEEVMNIIFNAYEKNALWITGVSLNITLFLLGNITVEAEAAVFHGLP